MREFEAIKERVENHVEEGKLPQDVLDDFSFLVGFGEGSLKIESELRDKIKRYEKELDRLYSDRYSDVQTTKL